MNYTDEQIRLAGFVQPDEGPRDFNSVLDLQGEGTRVLDQYIAEVEAEEGDCCADLEIAESIIGGLITEIEDLEEEIEDLEEDARFAGDTITLNAVAIFDTEINSTIQVTITLDSAVDAGGGSYTYGFSYVYTTTSDGTNPRFRTASVYIGGTEVLCIQIPIGGGSGSGTHSTTRAKVNQIECRAHASFSSDCSGAFGSGYEELGLITTGT